MELGKKEHGLIYSPIRKINPSVRINANQNGQEESGYEAGNRHQTEPQQTATADPFNSVDVMFVHALFVQHPCQSQQFVFTFAQFTANGFNGAADGYVGEEISRRPAKWNIHN